MTATAAPFLQNIAKQITDQLDRIPELLPFPAVAARLVAACRDASTSSKDLVEIAQCDPAIASKLLSVANSSMYGYSGRIRTVQHAVVVLGFREVARLALSVAAQALFTKGKTAKEKREALWNHSLGVATVARMLVQHVQGMLPDEAFLAGIFHDVGKLLFYKLVPEPYEHFVGRYEQADHWPPDQVVSEEKETFGIAHGELGQRCGESWGLTNEINSAVAQHHTAHSTTPPLALVTGAADVLARAWQIGSDLPPARPETANPYLELLGVDQEILETVREEASKTYQEVRQACLA